MQNQYSWELYTKKNDEDYISHHGVKGQKWGVRRYQNSDGSYTSAGRSRYGIGDGKSRSASRKEIRSANRALKQAGQKAYDSATFSDAFKRQSARDQRRVDWLEKRGASGKRLRAAKERASSSSAMYKGYKELNKQDIANYQRLSNQLTKKYGSQNIKQTSLKTTKSGASYVKGKFFTYANDTSYQAIATPTTTTDSAGRKHYGYRSTKLYTYVY